MSIFTHLILQELRLLKSSFMETFLIFTFYFLTLCLFIFGLGEHLNMLPILAPSILWSGLLLTCFLFFNRFFENEYREGIIEYYLFSPLSLEWCVLAKMIGQTLSLLIPLILFFPLFSNLLQMPDMHLKPTLCSLLIAFPSLINLTIAGSALVIGAKNGKFILPLILLPFYVPILIFAISASTSDIYDPAFIILTGFFLLFMALCPFITALSLRASIEER